MGLAVSDALGIAAHGLKTLERKTLEQDFETIERIVEERGIEGVVLGLPRNMDGSLGPQAKRVQAFAEKLKERLGLPVHMVDERLTTERAQRTMLDAGLSLRRRRERVDRMAAQFILQQFLAMSTRSTDGEPPRQ